MNRAAGSSSAEYTSRIDNAVAYINRHLTEPLPLEVLAQAAFFSPFHFHRIFSSIVGETPADFIARLRLERAANLIIADPGRPLTDVALSSGFSSSSVFSRSFRKHFGMSASEWSKKCKTESKNGKENPSCPPYIGTAIHAVSPKRNKTTTMKVKISQQPLRHVAFVANLGGYNTAKISAAWEKLCCWAQANDLFGKDSLMIGVSYDNPDITPADRCRYYACLTVPADIHPGKGIGLMDIPGGRHAIVRFEGTAEKIAGAYRDLYAVWLPRSGYQPADAPCYEIYHRTPDMHSRKKFIMDIYLPLRPL
jgi:AraC family transcriptional regulator